MALFRATPNLERKKVDVAYEVLTRENNTSSHLCNLWQNALHTKQELLISIIMTKYTAPCLLRLGSVVFWPLLKLRYFSNQLIKLHEIWWAYFQYYLANTCRIL